MLQLEEADVQAAYSRIKALVHETPVFSSQALNQLLGCDVIFKGEHLQVGGAFKARGATNMVYAQPQSELASGVCTHSSGNHGAALARAARARGVAAHIVMPTNASPIKRRLVDYFGGHLTECDNTLEAREKALKAVADSTGALYVPPFDAPLIIAGQGTALLEFKGQTPKLDAVVVPVGGGGLLAGCCLVQDRPLVYGAEPEGASDAARSFATGERVSAHTPDTICDGLRTTMGALNFEMIKRGATDILTASDADTIFAMQLIWQFTKQWVEPSSAVALSVVMRNRSVFVGKRVGIILTGGNVDLDRLGPLLLNSQQIDHGIASLTHH
ncbi:MAG: pyridoxal-phosphate dependent enzyme [Pseudomonadales bacterium]|nr:pyridoxal-phosphate dependent enzyme [Pseudomonadales bacterium]